MSSSKTKVLFCTDGIFPHMVGGIQRHSRLLAESLSKLPDIDLSVIHPHEGITVFDPALGIKEIVVVPEKSSGTYLIDCYKFSKQVMKVSLQYRDAVIYAQGLTVWSGIGAVKNRLILNPHGLESLQTLTMKENLIGMPFRMIMRHQFKNSRYVVSLGGRLTGLINKMVPVEKIAVLPNAVNVPPLIARNFSAKPMKFLFVGRFAFNKGIDILATAVKELNAEGWQDRTEFNLVGKGPLFDEYVKTFDFPNLHFLGFASDEKLEELYRTNDVFVLPTLFEGMPTVVLEAMANGMPIIVTDTGATTEMVDKANGIIIEKRDVASLKKAIINFVESNEQSRRERSRASYEKVKNNFSWERIAGLHAGLFKQVSREIKSDA